MPIPLFDLTRQNDALMEELTDASTRVLRSGQFILGKEMEALEAEAAALLGAERSLAVSSGTDALLLALMAAGIGPGDEVIVPDFTFFATAGCVARTGARPVFVDICPLCFNLLPEAVEAALTERTKAILPVHLFGQSADMKSLMAIAEKAGVKVIEDCAQSIGAKHHGTATGCFGDFAAISFFPTKNLGGFGDSGLLLAKAEADFDRAKILRVHGMEPKYYHPEIGANFRMDALQAALLRVKIPHLSSYNEARRGNADHYKQTLADHSDVWLPTTTGDCPFRGECNCKDEPEARLILPFTYPHNEVIWNQFTVRIPGAGQREDFRAHLQKDGIGSEIYYPLPLSQQECFQPYKPAECPNAAKVATECVSLPIFPELREDERETVVKSILAWLG